MSRPIDRLSFEKSIVRAGIGRAPWRSLAGAHGCPPTPRLSAKVGDNIGLYLNPPDRAPRQEVTNSGPASASGGVAAGARPYRRRPLTSARDNEIVRRARHRIGHILAQSRARHHHQECLALLQQNGDNSGIRLAVDDYAAHKHLTPRTCRRRDHAPIYARPGRALARSPGLVDDRLRRPAVFPIPGFASANSKQQIDEHQVARYISRYI
jgi:hypothetical protein